MHPAVLFLALDGAGVPDWVRLMPVGEFRPTNPRDTRGPYRLTDVPAVIAASLEGGALTFDVNHSTTMAGARGEEAPARGWIVEMEVRDGFLCGRVEWTEAGRAAVAAKEYRGVSPEFDHDAKGVVTRLLRASLTNNPALTNLTLFTHQETRMDLVQLRAALGLPETADATACLTAVAAHRQAAETATAQFTAVATAAGLPAATSSDALVAALTALRAGQTEVATLTAQVSTLTTQLATMQADTARGRATAFIDAQIAAGKPIVPQRDVWIGMHLKDEAGTVALLTALPSLNAGGVAPGPGAGGGGDQPLPEETQVAALMGMDVTKLVAERKRVAALTAGGAA